MQLDFNIGLKRRKSTKYHVFVMTRFNVVLLWISNTGFIDLFKILVFPAFPTQLQTCMYFELYIQQLI